MHFLYHSFPRLAARQRADELNCDWRQELHDDLGLCVLSAILQEGLLLTPEKFEVGANPRIRRSRPHAQTQIRASFTLSTLEEIGAAPTKQPGGFATHSYQFGGFAFALDPLEARDIGAQPTIYFYRTPATAPDNSSLLQVEQGISYQLLYRLLEIMDILKVVARLEADNPKWRQRLSPAQLKSLGFGLEHYPEIEECLEKMSECGSAEEVHDSILNTDRVPAWCLISSIRQLLDLFQTADSRRDTSSLAHFQQREWRVLATVSSPDGQFDGQPIVPLKCVSPDTFRNVLEAPFRLLRGTEFEPAQAPAFVDKCWLVRRFGNEHFNRAIKQIVVPKRLKRRAKRVLAQFCQGHAPEVVFV